LTDFLHVEQTLSRPLRLAAVLHRAKGLEKEQTFSLKSRCRTEKRSANRNLTFIGATRH
jgi:hypothetical protein